MSKHQATERTLRSALRERWTPALTDLYAVSVAGAAAGLVAGVQTTWSARLMLGGVAVAVALLALFGESFTGLGVGIAGALIAAIVLQSANLWTSERFGWSLALCAVMPLLGWLSGVAAAAARASARHAARPRAGTVAPAYGSLGLLTSDTFEQRVTEEVARAERFGRPLTLVVIESRSVVDEPAAYQRARRSLARIMEATTRDTDVPADLGDGRFGLLLPETGESGAWDQLAPILRVTGQHTVELSNGGRAPVTSVLQVGIGVATIGADRAAAPDTLSLRARREAAASLDDLASWVA
ncbi:GGDEF domain-containing protein [Flexivirga meconopsidis]|uniref:GGDEF domain-containing protein n=1 Tax=Flexivirga meconopsidis TaxID=2977121 RepID=UPI00223EA630|nr:hypothetical protein [Flexivirga meconopsidis]